MCWFPTCSLGATGCCAACRVLSGLLFAHDDRSMQSHVLPDRLVFSLVQAAALWVSQETFCPMACQHSLQTCNWMLQLPYKRRAPNSRQPKQAQRAQGSRAASLRCQASQATACGRSLGRLVGSSHHSSSGHLQASPMRTESRTAQTSVSEAKELGARQLSPASARPLSHSLVPSALLHQTSLLGPQGFSLGK